MSPNKCCGAGAARIHLHFDGVGAAMLSGFGSSSHGATALADPNPTHFSTHKYLIKTKHEKVFKVL
jgi:hypothetical protein